MSYSNHKEGFEAMDKSKKNVPFINTPEADIRKRKKRTIKPKQRNSKRATSQALTYATKAGIKGTKKLNKQLKKSIKKAKKDLKKLKRNITRAYKKYTGKIEKRKARLNKWAEKAKALAIETDKVLDYYENAGYSVYDRDMVDRTMQRIAYLEAKSRPTDKDIQLMKEMASVRRYDYIKIGMTIRGDVVEGVLVPVDKEVNLREIRLARRRQVLSPDKITDKEQQILSHYVNALSTYASSLAPDLSTDEQQQKFKKSFKVERDVAIGGSSTLINDLSYTYDVLNEGRNFVEQLQQIMMNSEDFVLIEAWYRANPQIKKTIDEAVKSYWYEKFKDFSAAIIEAINNMPNLSSGTEDILKDMQERAEVIADEYYD